MILGNSNGKNKGKKYIRITGNEIVTPGNQKKADRFSKWFGDNYDDLCKKLSDQGECDLDIMNHTYLKLYDRVLYGGLIIENYENYFHRSYYTNIIQTRQKENRYRELLPNVDKEDIDSDFYSELDEKRKDLEKDIMNYVYSNYNIRDFELFKMYMNLKPAVNYSTLSKITGLKYENVQRIVSKIKKGIQKNKEFVKRRKELL